MDENKLKKRCIELFKKHIPDVDNAQFISSSGKAKPEDVNFPTKEGKITAILSEQKDKILPEGHSVTQAIEELSPSPPCFLVRLCHQSKPKLCVFELDLD